MNDFEKRIDGFSAARKKIFEQLKAKRTPSAAISASVTPSAPSRLSFTNLTEKGKARDFYNSINESLDATLFGPFTFFLNYGYVSNGNADFAAVQLPDHYLNRNSVKLVLETIADCPINGAFVLDVSCGRGGTVHTIKNFFKPGRIVAMDLSSSAIRFSRVAHRYPDVSFLEADAESLPFSGSHFHVVINIEASHLYPNTNAFLDEVFRVLRPNGYFLYADLLASEQMALLSAYLRQLGFVIEQERDITDNVVLSCDQIARQRLQAYRNQDRARVLEDFLATPGSPAYEDLKRRAWKYQIITARKP